MSGDRAAPPHNIQVEQALLGAVLLNAAAFDFVENVVEPEDFSERLHGEMFGKLRAAHESGYKIDVRLASAFLREIAQDEISSGFTVAQYLARLAAEATTVVNARDYARTIRDLADRRRLIAAAVELNELSGSDLSPAEVAATLIADLDKIASSSEMKTPIVSLAEAGAAAVANMQRGIANPDDLPGMTTGLRDLDEKIGGLHRGELLILAARPSIGKTALAISCARGSAQAKHPALFNSLEMSEVSIGDRMLADMAFDSRDPIEFISINRGRVTNAQHQRIVDAQRKFGSIPLLIDPQSGLSVAQIAARARRYQRRLEHRGQRMDTLWVDHLHLVRASERYKGNRVAEITEISGALKSLAKELDIAVVALAQLSRSPESRDDKRPVLSDLRDSGSIEQDADTIIFLYRESYYLERAVRTDPEAEAKRLARLAQVANDLEAIVAKQRNGPIGTVHLFYDVGCNAIRDAARLSK
jgi:replicative DNA helicase